MASKTFLFDSLVKAKLCKRKAEAAVSKARASWSVGDGVTPSKARAYRKAVERLAAAESAISKHHAIMRMARQ